MIRTRATVGISLAAVGVLAAARLIDFSALPFGDVCLSQRLFGVPCGGCGLTRAFGALSHGRLEVAFALNPFSFLLFGLTLAAVFLPILNRISPEITVRMARSRWLKAGVVILVASMVVFGVARSVPVILANHP